MILRATTSNTLRPPSRASAPPRKETPLIAQAYEAGVKIILGPNPRIHSGYGCILPRDGGKYCVDVGFPPEEASPPDLSIFDGDPKRFQSTNSKGKTTTYVLTTPLKSGELPSRFSSDGKALMTTQGRRITFTKVSK